MNEIIKLMLELAMTFSFITALMVLICRLAWSFWYYVVAAKNPIGKTVLTGIAALWIICGGFLAII